MGEWTPSESDVVFSKVAVEQGLAKSEHVEECLRILSRLAGAGVDPLPRLADLLVQKGYLLPDRFQATLRAESAPAPAPTPRTEPALPAEAASADPALRTGRYLRVSRLGEGGMGEVWRAWDGELRRWVALKLLKFSDAAELGRFRREAQTAGRLTHPNIAAVYEARDNYIAMQLVDGTTLLGVPRADRRRLAELVRDAARAVHYAHGEGVIHRDLKPQNIMVETKSSRVYVMDFGLAKQTSVDSSVSVSGSIVGTPSYMSPEQACGLAEVDARSDVYSLGATLYAILSGRPPFDGDTPYEVLKRVIEEEPVPLRRIDPRIEADLETIATKCLEKDRSRRYTGARDLADDLTRWLEGEAILAHPPSALYRFRKRLAKRRSVLVVAAIGAAAVMGVSAWIGPRWLRESKARAEQTAAREQKERELREVQEKQLADFKAQERARSRMDAARVVMERLDRLLATDVWTEAQAQALAGEARKRFEEALQEYDALPEADLEIGRIWALGRNNAKALESYTRAIGKSADFTPAYLERALLKLEDYDSRRHSGTDLSKEEAERSAALRREIEADLEAVRRGSRERKELLYAEGALAFAEGRYQAAAERLTEYSRIAISDPRGWALAGHAWLHAGGKQKEAIETLNEAIRYRPRDLNARLHLGMATRETGNNDRAIEIFTKNLQYQEDSIEYFYRALAKFDKGDYEGSKADNTQAIRLSPGYMAAWENRAIVRGVLRDYAGAIEDWTQALKLNPKASSFLVQRGLAHSNLKHLKEAEEDMTAAITISPEWGQAY